MRMARAAPSPLGVGRGDVVGVAASCRSRPARRRCARRGPWRAPAPRAPGRRRPRPCTKPSRSSSKGRLAPCGSSLRVLRACAAAKPGDADGADRRLAAAGDHDVGVAVADEAPGVPDRVRGGGAGRAGRAQRTLGAQLERDVRRAHVGDHHGDQQRVGAVGALVEELVGLDVQRLQAADPARR